jgi:uncharacterized protein (UPF0332 family)
MNPRDYLQIARDILRVDKPANCRTVFNRAYYAAYNVGFVYLKSAGMPISEGPGGHGDVNNYFQNCGVEDLKVAYQKLSNLYSDRIHADYRLNKKNVERIDNAKMALKKAECIIKITDLYSSGAKRKKAIKGLNIYKQKISPASKTP